MTISRVVCAHLTQSMCAGVRDGLVTAGLQAWDATKRHDRGHLASALGQARHFYSNEQFVATLDANNIDHNPLRGNDIIVGTLGPLLLCRFATKTSGWNNARRSKRRLEVAKHNAWLERLVQPGLFAEQLDHSQIAVFFVSVYSTSWTVHAEQPVATDIAIMDSDLRGRLFSAPLDQFLGRYALPADQQDKVEVRIKKSVKRLQDQ